MVWARIQYQWKGKKLSFRSVGGGKKCYLHNVFSDVIFHPHILQQSRVSKTIPTPACLVAMMIWHCCYSAQIFEVGIREYISPRIDFRHFIARSLKNGRVNIESRKFKLITKCFITKIYLERFTKLLNYENLELYGIGNGHMQANPHPIFVCFNVLHSHRIIAGVKDLLH